VTLGVLCCNADERLVGRGGNGGGMDLVGVGLISSNIPKDSSSATDSSDSTGRYTFRGPRRFPAFLPRRRWVAGATDAVIVDKLNRSIRLHEAWDCGCPRDFTIPTRVFALVGGLY
jgi:hypothetical protein